MSTSSKNSNHTPEDCSEEENLQTQLDDDIYISEPDDDNIEIELDEEKIQVKLISKVESAVWKCSKCSAIFRPTTSTSSIRSHLQNQHKLLLNKEILDSIVKKYSSEIQAEKNQAVLNGLF
ncbi:25388_t:CDS:2 [Gigaspora margarita]|uniref:25388_t:CDS:1 n=1 Tax=Gigaspora margarita TaxID=4874 RepID=A0ABN7VKC0_GIGMA|nr:25388_t:CDS:2 [Gigaspora margarita]